MPEDPTNAVLSEQIKFLSRRLDEINEDWTNKLDDIEQTFQAATNRMGAIDIKTQLVERDVINNNKTLTDRADKHDKYHQDKEAEARYQDQKHQFNMTILVAILGVGATIVGELVARMF